MIYFKLSNLDEALFYIRESISIDSSNVIIREHLNEVIKVKAEKNIEESRQGELVIFFLFFSVAQLSQIFLFYQYLKYPILTDRKYTPVKVKVMLITGM